MSEEIKNEAPAQEPATTVADESKPEVKSETKVEAPTEVVPATEEDSSKEIVNPLTGEVIRPAKPKEEAFIN